MLLQSPTLTMATIRVLCLFMLTGLALAPSARAATLTNLALRPQTNVALPQPGRVLNPPPFVPRRANPAPAFAPRTNAPFSPPQNNLAFQPRNAGTNLVFDAMIKEYAAKDGETTANFSFSLTNTGPADITIRLVRASCGCTTPKLPPLPWTLKPGESGSFQVAADLRGKFGLFQKAIMVDSSEGMKVLYVKCQLPNTPVTVGAAPVLDARTRNMQLAHADRQVVFRNDCADCHSKPAVGKRGEELFVAACGICHEADHRATMVPDLLALKNVPTAAYWEAWIRNGKVGSLMPAFALEHKGPLDDEQIKSLVDFLMTDFPQRQPHGKTVAQTPKPPTAVHGQNIPLPGTLPFTTPTDNISAPPSPIADPNTSANK